MPAISVIIPVYNAHVYFAEALPALLHQTFQDYELIFINDGSTDDSEAILQKLAQEDVRVQVLSQENKGQGAARNKGIDRAKGDFICFVDIDDAVSEKMLERLYQKAQQEDADIVWCSANLIKNGEKVGCLDDTTIWSDDDEKNYVLHHAGPCRKLIKRQLLIDHALYFPKLRAYEDLAVVPHYGQYAKRIAYVEEALYDYVLHEGSTMHQSTYNDKLECIFPCMEHLYNGFDEAHRVRYHDELEYLFTDHLLHAASLRFFAFAQGKQALDRIVKVMQTRFPDWRKNVYVKQKNWKYRLICTLFYQKRYRLLKWLLR